MVHLCPFFVPGEYCNVLCGRKIIPVNFFHGDRWFAAIEVWVCARFDLLAVTAVLGHSGTNWCLLDILLIDSHGVARSAFSPVLNFI